MKWILVLFTLLSFSTGLNAQDKEKRFELADSLSDAKEYQKALVIFEKLCDEEPNNPTYLSHAGIAYFRLERFDKAKEKFRLAVLYSQDNETHLSNLAAAYSNINENQKAYEYALKAMHVKPTSLTVYNAMANANNIYKYEETFRIYKQYPELTTENKFNLVLGLAHYHTLNFEKSASYFETFLAHQDESDRLMKQEENTKSYLFNSYIGQLIKQIVYKQGDKEASMARLTALRDESYDDTQSQRYETRILVLLMITQLLDSPAFEYGKELLLARPSAQMKLSMNNLSSNLNEVNDKLKRTLNESIRKEDSKSEDYRVFLASDGNLDLFLKKLISGNIL